MATELMEGAVSIRKNATEAVVVEPTTYNGTELLDVRVWVADAAGRPEARTRKGLCLRPETWAELLPIIAVAAGGDCGDETAEAEA